MIAINPKLERDQSEEFKLHCPSINDLEQMGDCKNAPTDVARDATLEVALAIKSQFRVSGSWQSRNDAICDAVRQATT
jgi:hypothetical protein